VRLFARPWSPQAKQPDTRIKVSTFDWSLIHTISENIGPFSPLTLRL